MKIICIGRNYAKHAKELNSEVPTEPVFFLKPDTAIVKNNNPFFLPDFSEDLHHEIELVVKISRVGKNIPEKFAHRYYEEIGLGIDFTARDLQEKCKNKGLPWEIAKAFDNSAPISEFLPLSDYNLENLNFSLKINGEIRQTGCTKDLLFSVDQLIAYVSKFITLKIGDLLFTGTPEGVGPVKINDRLEAYLEDKKLLDFYVK